MCSSVRKTWLGMALMATSLLGASTGCDRGSQPLNIGKLAPVFVVGDGVQTVDLAKLRGRVVILNLWATWCVPCVEELPSLLALQRKMPGLAIVAVSSDQDDQVYRDFLAKYHIDLLTVRDSGMKVQKLYGTELTPETYIIDRNGVLRRKFIGAQDWTGAEIVDYLNKL